jgi:hypothetical protein
MLLHKQRIILCTRLENRTHKATKLNLGCSTLLNTTNVATDNYGGRGLSPPAESSRPSGFGGLEVACSPLVPKLAGFKPGRSRRIFQGETSSARVPFGREGKLWVPCHRFTACKRSLNATWKSGIFRINLPAVSRPTYFHLWLLGSLEDE